MCSDILFKKMTSSQIRNIVNSTPLPEFQKNTLYSSIMAVFHELEKASNKHDPRNFNDRKKGNGDIIDFGKYRGRSAADIAKDDKPYLQWVYDNVNLQNDTKLYIHQELDL